MYVYLCVYVCMYVCIYVYMYIYNTGKTLCKYGPVFAPYLHDWTIYGIKMGPYLHGVFPV